MIDAIYYFEFAAVIAGTLTWRYYKDTPCRYFLFYLWFVLLVETLGKIEGLEEVNPDHGLILFLKHYLPYNFIRSNIWLIDIYDLVTFIFYMYFFYLLFQKRRNKMIALIFMPLLCIVFGLNLADNLKNGVFFDAYLTYYIILGSLLILICCCIYFMELLNSDHFLKFYQLLPIWIILGTLIFHLVLTPATIFTSYYEFNNAVYVFILAIANYFLYGFITTGFIVNAIFKRKAKKAMKRANEFYSISNER